MRRLVLLLSAGAIWLFLAALPALADGGPHVASINNGSSSLTTDSCAGCHRIHTAQAPLLLKTDEEALCLSCHGAATTGATTDVETGIQYVPASDGTRTGTQLGALRNGGFVQARIGDPFRMTTSTGSRYGKVQVADAPEAVNSAHLPELAGLTQPGRAWGNGANGSGAGPVVDISCGSCHNPHGNGQYRILNTSISTQPGFNDAWIIPIFDVDTAGVYRTVSSSGLIRGDVVTVTGNSEATANVTDAVVATVTSSSFTLVGITPAAAGTGGSAERVSPVKVTDAPLPVGDTRNYTVIQTAATHPDGFTLTASEAAAFDPLDGDYFRYRVPWDNSTTTNYDAPNGLPNASSDVGGPGFSNEITAWCTQCHTRYYAYQNPLEGGVPPATGAAYANARPGDPIYTYQHRTRGERNRGCQTCHVSHGSNAAMTGAFSSTFTYPDGTVSASSRLLKVDNRGTCQQCHDPTGTSAPGDQYPPAPYPVPGVP